MDSIKALWESGDVERFHTVPHLRPYTVAQHCWRMLMLLYKLHPCPHRQLVGAILFHDSAERWTGDIPAPAKWWIVDADFDVVEERILTGLGVHFDLEDHDQHWLKALDLLELYLYCLDELSLGNSNLQQVSHVCLRILNELWVPEEIKMWLETKTWQRTDDAFGKQ